MFFVNVENFNDMRIVNDTVENSLCNWSFRELRMPTLRVELRTENRR